MPRKSEDKVVDPNETPEQAFRRLANARTKKVLKSVDTLAGLANGRYERTDEQVSNLFAAIRSAVDAAEATFSAPATSAAKDLPDII
jgi:hypothetical protein